MDDRYAILQAKLNVMIKQAKKASDFDAPQPSRRLNICHLVCPIAIFVPPDSYPCTFSERERHATAYCTIDGLRPPL